MSHRVTCLLEDAPAAQPRHAHVVSVRTRGTGDVDERWSVVGIVSAVRAGHRFTAALSDGREVAVEPVVCPTCPLLTISTPDPLDLAQIPRCG